MVHTKSHKAHTKRRVKSKSSKKKSQKGGGYGNTMNSMKVDATSNMGYGYSGPAKYNHCGGSKGLNGNVAIFNNRVGYGYTNEGSQMASAVQGSYAPVSRYVGSQCGAGKKHKKKKKSKSMRKNKSRKSRKHLKKSKKHKKSKASKHKKTKKHKKGKKGKKHQKGGYSQYGNNTPIGTSFESPNPTPPLNSLGPLSINKTNVNCVDNYNHFKK